MKSGHSPIFGNCLTTMIKYCESAYHLPFLCDWGGSPIMQCLSLGKFTRRSRLLSIYFLFAISPTISFISWFESITYFPLTEKNNMLVEFLV